MARFSRGAQLSNKQVTENREKRRQQIAERNKEMRQDKLKRLTKRGVIFLLLVLVGMYAFNRQFVRFDRDSINGEYLSTIDTYFGEKPLSTSKIFFNKSDLENYIIDKHPEVRAISYKSALIGKDNIEFATKEPTFIWQTDKTKYYGDEDGVIYEEAGSVSNGDLLEIRDGAKLDSQPGDKVASSNLLEYVDEIKSELANRSINIEYFSLPSTSREVHVHLEGKPFYVKMSIDRSVVGQSEELFKTLNYLESSNKAIKEYVDLRTEDRAYYR